MSSDIAAPRQVIISIAGVWLAVRRVDQPDPRSSPFKTLERRNFTGLAASLRSSLFVTHPVSRGVFPGFGDFGEGRLGQQ